jgi:hypothetical protein
MIRKYTLPVRSLYVACAASFIEARAWHPWKHFLQVEAVHSVAGLQWTVNLGEIVFSMIVTVITKQTVMTSRNRVAGLGAPTTHVRQQLYSRGIKRIFHGYPWCGSCALHAARLSTG